MSQPNVIVEKPARTCGDCSLCCKLLGVPEIAKPAGVWCDLVSIADTPGFAVQGPGVKPKGCSVYETRPQACRDFGCLWLQSADAGYPMDEDMRPDRCKVVFGGSLNGDKSVVYVDPANPEAWRAGRVRRTINRLLGRFEVVIVCGDRPRILLEPGAMLNAAGTVTER